MSVKLTHYNIPHPSSFSSLVKVSSFSHSSASNVVIFYLQPLINLNLLYSSLIVSFKYFLPFQFQVTVLLQLCCCLVAQSYLTLCDPWTEASQASLSFAISQTLLTLRSIESVIPPNHLILCHPLLLLPSVFPSIRVFSKESLLHIRWPKYWSFSFSISPSNEYLRLISFRLDWLDLLAV